MQRLTAKPVRKGAKQGVARVRPALPTARESVSATATPTAPVQDPEVLRVSVPKDVNGATAFARVALGPAVQAATTIRQCSTRIPTGLTELVDELATQSKAASDGNLGRSEAMLMSQAHTLVAIFNNLTRTAQGNRNNLAVFEPVLRLAFKAQSQSRATLETLAEIKYPRSVAFVRQANIATVRNR